MEVLSDEGPALALFPFQGRILLTRHSRSLWITPVHTSDV